MKLAKENKFRGNKTGRVKGRKNSRPQRQERNMLWRFREHKLVMETKRAF